MDWKYTMAVYALDIPPSFFEELDANKQRALLSSAASDAFGLLNDALPVRPSHVTQMEPVSHSLFRVGANLFVTILLRYQSSTNDR